MKLNSRTITSLWHKIKAKNGTELFNLVYVNLCGLMIVLFLYAIKPFKSIKLLEIRYRAIGQQAGNTGLFLRRLQLEKRRKENRILYVGISGTAENQQLLKMFKRKLFIIENDLLNSICISASVLRWAGFYERLPFESNEYYEFNSTEPDLQFTSSEEKEGRRLLNKMGIGNESWFVCFHCRDSAYQYGYVGDFRNADIKNYLDAANYITSCGGFAVRMGSTVAQKLPDLNNPRIIDYASQYRTDFGDIYLLAKCKFFLGSTSGPMVVPTLFNVPNAGANYIPFLTPFRTGDMFILKKIWFIEEKRFLTFREFIEFGDMIDGGYNFNIRVHNKLAEGKHISIENTPEEILDLAKEMNERLDGTFEITEEDEELQKKFHSLLQPDDYFYGTPARIGAKFLRQNKELLK